MYIVISLERNKNYISNYFRKGLLTCRLSTFEVCGTFCRNASPLTSSLLCTCMWNMERSELVWCVKQLCRPWYLCLFTWGWELRLCTRETSTRLRRSKGRHSLYLTLGIELSSFDHWIEDLVYLFCFVLIFPSPVTILAPFSVTF